MVRKSMLYVGSVMACHFCICSSSAQTESCDTPSGTVYSPGTTHLLNDQPTHQCSTLSHCESVLHWCVGWSLQWRIWVWIDTRAKLKSRSIKGGLGVLPRKILNFCTSKTWFWRLLGGKRSQPEHRFDTVFHTKRGNNCVFDTWDEFV